MLIFVVVFIQNLFRELIILSFRLSEEKIPDINFKVEMFF